MNRLLFSICLLIGACSLARGESLSPEETIRSLVQAAHKGDTNALEWIADFGKIASDKRHAMSRERVIQFLKRIDVSKIVFNQRAVTGWPSATTVRTTKPVAYDFDVELRRGTRDRPEDHYVVVALHP